MGVGRSTRKREYVSVRVATKFKATGLVKVSISIFLFVYFHCPLKEIKCSMEFYSVLCIPL